MRRREPLLLALLALAALGCAHRGASVPPPEVVPHVDLARYAGTWYEIARFPFRIQEGCFATVATYALRPDGRVAVVNQCRRDSFGGELAIARGTAKVLDPATNAKLEVTFFWPFAGDYWIIELGEDYDYSVVSGPERKYLWILSRTPTLPEGRYQEILERLKGRGFDVSRIVRTPQPEG